MFKKEKHHFFKEIFFQMRENMCEEYNYGQYEEILWEFLEMFLMIFGEELRITFRSSHREGEGVFFK